MATMNEINYRLYAGKEIFSHPTFEEAKEAAKSFMPNELPLRIEVLPEGGPLEADWWAYEYENKQWKPS